MTSNGATVLTAGQLTTGQLRALSLGGERIRLDDACWPAVEAAARVVEQAARGEAAVYGVNTGFGKLATTRIAPADILELQRRLVVSHMCGLGPPLPDPVVRLVLALKAASLALGHSGVQRRTIELLLKLLDHDALPVIPAKGSVGASGDLAPLAHLAGCLLGEGEIRHCRDRQARRRGPGRDRGGTACSSGPRRAWRCSTAPRCRRRWRWSAGSGLRRCSRRRWSRAP